MDLPNAKEDSKDKVCNEIYSGDSEKIHNPEQDCNDIKEEPINPKDAQNSEKTNDIDSVAMLNIETSNDSTQTLNELDMNNDGDKDGKDNSDSDSVVFSDVSSSNDNDDEIEVNQSVQEISQDDDEANKEITDEESSQNLKHSESNGNTVETPLVVSSDEKVEAQAFLNWCQQSLTLTKKDFRLRREAVNELQENLGNTNPEICVELYGSSFIGSAVKDSDVNVFLFSQDNVKHDILLSSVHDSLSKNDSYDNIQVHYDSKCVSLSVRDKSRNLTLIITEHKSMHLKSNTIVKRYLELDPRALALQQAIRIWASVCGLDNQQKGSLPVVSYYIMVIHFLQQQNPPVLPCIHEMVIKKERKVHNLNDEEMDRVMQLKWKSKNKEPADVLFSKFFKFYLDARLCKSRYTITIKQYKPLNIIGKKWSQNSIAIEDPLSQETNLGTSMKNGNVLKYFDQCLRYTNTYLNNPKMDDRELKYVSKLSEKDRKHFYKLKFSHQNSPIIYCFNCNGVGHWLKTCPSIAPVDCQYDLPGTTYMTLLGEVLDRLVFDYDLNSKDAKNTKTSLKLLHEIIRVDFPGSKLCLFGSSVNGFGFAGSDLDVCMMSHGPTEPEDLDKPRIIKFLANLLRSQRNIVRNVRAIPSAKVPIVRFELQSNGQEVDISLYNCLALKNSQLLHAYCQLDPRVKTLGFTVKLFAKLAKIKDASQGSLSSYAYILMLVYFLQHTSPPILPHLQELYEGDQQPKDIIDGCNTWFYNDVNRIHEVWQPEQINEQTTSELWLEFLHFYAAKFNWKEDVVCIRKSSKMTKLSKGWLSHSFAIEDPFELQHNLGNVVKQDMSGYILLMFARTLKHFTKERDGTIYTSVMARQEHFFDFSGFIVESNAPQQRCFNCHRVGHFSNECNMKQEKENRWKNKRNGKRDFKSEGDRPTPEKDNNKGGNAGAGKRNERPRAKSTPNQRNTSKSDSLTPRKEQKIATNIQPKHSSISEKPMPLTQQFSPPKEIQQNSGGNMSASKIYPVVPIQTPFDHHRMPLPTHQTSPTMFNTQPIRMHHHNTHIPSSDIHFGSTPPSLDPRSMPLNRYQDPVLKQAIHSPPQHVGLHHHGNDVNRIQQMRVIQNSPPRRTPQGQQSQFDNQIPFPRQPNHNYQQQPSNQHMSTSPRIPNHLVPQNPEMGQALLNQWMNQLSMNQGHRSEGPPSRNQR